MAEPIKQGEAVIWLKGETGDYEPYAAGADGASATGKTIPVIGVAPVFTRDVFNMPVVLGINETPPGDLPTFTLTVYEKKDLNVLERMLMTNCPFAAQLRIAHCGTLDDPQAASKIWHFDRGKLTSYSPGDGPALEFNNTYMQAAGTLVFRGYVIWVETGLDGLASGVTEDVLSIAGLPDPLCNDCGYGYPGADQFLVAGLEAAAAAQAVGLFSTSGGGAWTAFTNDPMTVADQHLDFAFVRLIGPDRARVIFGTKTSEAGQKPHWSYGDVEWGNEAAVTFTRVDVAQAANAAALSALGWFREIPRRVYAAVDGDIYISKNQGTSAPDAAVYTGATAINVFAPSPDGVRMWAAGASNLILVERRRSDQFVARVGPTGGGAFTALTEADDGTLFAGNGTSIYKSNNQARNAGGWTELYDFGAAKAVRTIQCVRGSSEILRVTVDDTTPGTGEEWESLDGGLTWSQITERANTGYNQAYYSISNHNLKVIAGDGGTIHLLSPIEE